MSPVLIARHTALLVDELDTMSSGSSVSTWVMAHAVRASAVLGGFDPPRYVYRNITGQLTMEGPLSSHGDTASHELLFG